MHGELPPVQVQLNYVGISRTISSFARGQISGRTNPHITKKKTASRAVVNAGEAKIVGKILHLRIKFPTTWLMIEHVVLIKMMIELA